jgi:hypothetical protein
MTRQRTRECGKIPANRRLDAVPGLRSIDFIVENETRAIVRGHAPIANRHGVIEANQRSEPCWPDWHGWN